MGKLKQTLIITFLMLAGSFCFAKQISFQVVQHNSKTDKITEDSLIVEDELLNGLFNCGYIVTNSPVVISDSKGQDELFWSEGLGDAYEGSSDYFVQVKLYYSERLTLIDWSISSAVSGEKIKMSSLENKSTSKPVDDLKNISALLVSEINKVVKANKA